jgi:hypothetical protein
MRDAVEEVCEGATVLILEAALVPVPHKPGNIPGSSFVKDSIGVLERGATDTVFGVLALFGEKRGATCTSWYHCHGKRKVLRPEFHLLAEQALAALRPCLTSTVIPAVPGGAHLSNAWLTADGAAQPLCMLYAASLSMPVDPLLFIRMAAAARSSAARSPSKYAGPAAQLFGDKAAALVAQNTDEGRRAANESIKADARLFLLARLPDAPTLAEQLRLALVHDSCVARLPWP